MNLYNINIIKTKIHCKNTRTRKIQENTSSKRFSMQQSGTRNLGVGSKVNMKDLYPQKSSALRSKKI